MLEVHRIDSNNAITRLREEGKGRHVTFHLQYIEEENAKIVAVNWRRGRVVDCGETIYITMADGQDKVFMLRTDSEDLNLICRGPIRSGGQNHLLTYVLEDDLES